MKNAILLFVIFSLCIMTACEDNNFSGPITGYWLNAEENDSIITFQKSSGLKDNEYGIAFQGRGVFVERKIAGWCGTPPVTYTDYEGSWEKSDSIIKISVGFWGGTEEYEWKLLELDDNHLTVRIISEKVSESFYEQ